MPPLSRNRSRQITAVGILLCGMARTAPAEAMLAIDCAKPVAPVDRLVCSDRSLAVLNHAMAERFQRLQQAMSKIGFALMRTAQQEWLRGMRSACAPGAERNGATQTPEAAAECIRQAYSERTNAIDASIGIAGTLVLEGRQQLRRWRKPKVTETYSYPWLTGAPTDKVAAFNRQITQLLNPARSLYLTSGVKPDPTTGGETVFDRFYEIHRFDERLISIEIFDHHEANFGHGWRSEFVINWNLTLNRPLDIADVFAADRDWQQPVADAALKAAQDDYDPKYAAEMITPEAVDSADAWLFSKDSATLMLGHGERSMVGASIEVPIPYSALAPYFRPDAPLPGAGNK